MIKLLVRLSFIVVVTFSTANYLVPELLIYLFNERYVAFNQAMARGDLSLIQQRFHETPKDQWPVLAQNLDTAYAPIDLELIPIADSAISTEERAQLARGDNAVRLGVYGMLETALTPLDREFVVVQRLPPLPLDINLVFWAMNVLTGAALLICLLLWVRPHWRDLERLRETAVQLGGGNLAARTNIPSGSNIASLAQVFDMMAADVERLMRQQQDLLNAVAHELRTPMSRLDFGLELLLSDDLPESSRSRLHEMKAHIRELDELVLELLTYGRLQGSIRLTERTEVNIGEYLDSIAGAFAEELEHRSIAFDVHIPDARSVASLEPRLTARVLQNLIRNAMRYCNERIDIRVLEQGPNGIAIAVDDDGIGIPAEDRETIFQPFYRLDRSRDRSTGGFGLGLAISKRAVEIQGGVIEVCESPLGGARVVVKLPNNERATVETPVR